MKDGDIGHAVRELVVAWLAWHEQVDRRERTAELADRVEGYRVVDGGQVDPDGYRRGWPGRSETGLSTDRMKLGRSSRHRSESRPLSPARRLVCPQKKNRTMKR